ncbi:MAG: ribonuclease E inhibitor RraB [Deltaproteobacteria bacterium]|nr:ribonuclease E inhibitor RraB [Deltaproteobacteria bacterium]
MNPKSLDLLQDRGCKIGEERDILNVFYAADSSACNGLTDGLLGKGFRDVSSTWEAEGRNGLPFSLTATLSIRLDLKTLNNMTDVCSEVADRWQVVYDGWYTEV